jgi:hypothetical protein
MRLRVPKWEEDTMPEGIETREARRGSRMIELRVRFWTDNLAEGKGRIRPKHAWTGGVVRMSPNKAHGITPKNLRPFNSMADMVVVMERVLVDHAVKLHPARKTEQKLLAVQ